MSTPLLELVSGDDAARWAELGFTIGPLGEVRLGPVVVRLDGQGGGLREWVLGGEEGQAAIDGIATTWRGGPPAGPDEPNGSATIDHVVVFTDSRDRTVAALVDAGGDLRRSGGPPELPAPMAFVRMGSVIVEVAENAQADAASLWGLVAVVPDVDALAASRPGLFGEPRDAVQPGRRIVTARRRDGLETALAFMTPR